MVRVPRFAILVLALTLGAWLRCSGLSASGFNEDEIDIVRATASYGQLDFSANAEHPMLAKLAAFASLEASSIVNRVARQHGLPGISRETAIRFPMAFVGGVLTTAALYLLASELFADPAIAVIAAVLWAVDPNATGINRTAKEDTLFLFFFLLAAWCYARAKREGVVSVPRARRWYAGSGAAFGLMMASKYMPHYYGLHALVYRITDPRPGENRPNPWHSYTAMAGAFLIGNFAVFLPSSWARLVQYFHGQTLSHTGYLFAHHLYVNSIFVTPGGVPPIFYVAFLSTKVPLAVLAPAMVGIVQMIRRPADRGLVFLRVLLVFFLLPYSLVGSKFVRYMLPLLVIVDLLAAVGIAALLRAALARRTQPAWRLAAVAGAALLVTAPLAASVSARPFFGLTRNAIGARVGGPGYLFPDDEFNDIGVREAVRQIAQIASPGAVIASDATTVVEEYLARFHRPDIHARSISRDGMPVQGEETWVIAQDGHTYFENAEVFETIRMQRQPWRELNVRGATALSVYRMPATAAADAVAVAGPGIPSAPTRQAVATSAHSVRARHTRQRVRGTEPAGPFHQTHSLQR